MWTNHFCSQNMKPFFSQINQTFPKIYEISRNVQTYPNLFNVVFLVLSKTSYYHYTVFNILEYCDEDLFWIFWLCLKIKWESWISNFLKFHNFWFSFQRPNSRSATFKSFSYIIFNIMNFSNLTNIFLTLSIFKYSKLNL